MQFHSAFVEAYSRAAATGHLVGKSDAAMVQLGYVEAAPEDSLPQRCELIRTNLGKGDIKMVAGYKLAYKLAAGSFTQQTSRCLPACSILRPKSD